MASLDPTTGSDTPSTSSGTGGSGYGAATADFGQAAQELLSVSTDRSVASLNTMEAGLYAQDITIEQSMAAIKKQQIQRQSYQVGSAIEANAGGNGLRMSGSASDIFRSSANQGALAVGIAGEEAQLKENSYAASQAAALEKAKAANGAITGAYVGAGFSVLSGIASIAGGA